MTETITWRPVGEYKMENGIVLIKTKTRVMLGLRVGGDVVLWRIDSGHVTRDMILAWAELPKGPEGKL